MSLEANKDLVRTYIETIFNQRQVERTDESPRRDRCADRRGHRAANDLAGVIAATAGTSTLPSLVVAIRAGRPTYRWKAPTTERSGTMLSEFGIASSLRWFPRRHKRSTRDTASGNGR